MADYYSEQRAEAASADVRRAESIVGRTAPRAEAYDNAPTRAPTALQEIRGMVGGVVERAGALRSRIGGVADRTFGEMPELNEKVHSENGPPYGGDMAELFYVVQHLSSIVDDANRQFNRLENIA